MVDGTYNGNYSGVTVTGNTVTGTKFFNVGIAIGASVWGGQSTSTLTGPAVVANNTFKGNITFPIAINGWSNGLTVTGNIVSSVAKSSKFSEGSACSYATEQVWAKSAALSYYSPGITGPKTLQPGFINSTAGSPTVFLCTTPILPNNTSWSAGSSLGQVASGTVANVHNGITWQFQGSDGNLVIYNTTLSSPTAGASVLWASGGAPGGKCDPFGKGNNLCYLAFQGDGNLVAYFSRIGIRGRIRRGRRWCFRTRNRFWPCITRVGRLFGRRLERVRRELEEPSASIRDRSTPSSTYHTQN